MANAPDSLTDNEIDIELDALLSQREVERKEERQKQFAEYSKLTAEEQWEKVDYFLDEYYCIWGMVINAGSSGRREHEDMDTANFHLAVLTEILGKWELRMVEEEYRVRKFRAFVGSEAFHRKLYGIENLAPLPENAVAFQFARDIQNQIQTQFQSARCAEFETAESARIVLHHDNHWDTIVFFDAGFTANLHPKTDLQSKCEWEDPEFFPVLMSVLSEILEVELEISGDGLITRGEKVAPFQGSI